MGSDVLPNEKYSGDLIENVVSAPDTFHNILQTPILTLEEQLLESKAKKDKLHAEEKQNKEDYIKYNDERLDLIKQLNEYKKGEKNQNVTGDLKKNLDDYFHKHSDIGSAALKKRNG